MSRNLGAVALRQLFAQESDEAWVLLLTIVHDALATPIRVASKGTVSGDVEGEHASWIEVGPYRYYAYPFLIDIPEDRDDALARVTLQIDNVDRSITETLRQITTPATVSLSVVMESAPSVVQAGPYEFQMASTTIDATTIIAELAYEPLLSEPFPAGRFTPGLFPGLFS